MDEKTLARAILKEQRHQKQRGKKVTAVAAVLASGIGHHMQKQLAEKPTQPLGYGNALHEMARLLGYDKYTPEVGKAIDAEHQQRLARNAAEDQK